MLFLLKPSYRRVTPDIPKGGAIMSPVVGERQKRRPLRTLKDLRELREGRELTEEYIESLDTPIIREVISLAEVSEDYERALRAYEGIREEAKRLKSEIEKLAAVEAFQARMKLERDLSELLKIMEALELRMMDDDILFILCSAIQ